MQKQSAAWFLVGVLVGSIAVAIWKEHSIADLRSALKEASATNERLKYERVSLKPELQPSSLLPVLPAKQSPSAKPMVAGRPQGVIDSNRQAVAHTYGRILGKLSLSDAQRALVESLLIERFTALQEIRSLNIERAEANRLIAAFEAENEGALRDAVDSATGDRISKMLRYTALLGRAESLANLSDQDPYALDQILEMARIFSDATARNPTQNQISPDAIDAASGLAEYDRQILAEASSVLSPRQVEGLGRLLATQRARSTATFQAQQEIKKAILGEAEPNSRSTSTPKN